MEIPLETAARVPSAPNWGQIQRDIFCPLCDYNLRGLIEPRCPECGHRFVWAELVSPRDETLPFLFEHRPDRNVRSFFQTLRKSLWSLSFWRTLRPTHTLHVRRLVLFWMLVVGALIPLILGASVWRAIQLKQRIHEARLSQAQYIKRSPTDPYYVDLLKRHGSIQAVVDAQLPMPGFFKLMTGGSGWDWQFTHYVVPAAAFNLLWPWLTVAALLIFRASLKQARIKFGHVLRCAVYSHSIYMPLIVLAMVMVWLLPSGPIWSGYVSSILGVSRAMCVLAIAVMLLTWRLAVAYRLYLRFPHAIRTVIASQVIVGLALFKAYLVWLGF
jgi:hypothetical protein